MPDRAPEAPQAALSRGRVALENGRFALAEVCLERAALAGGTIADEARRQLSRLYWKTGRHAEHVRALERLIERLPDPSEELRLLWNSETQTYPIGDMREQIGKALSGSPDDRVWLAAADLAVREGKLDEASDWLAGCERAGPTTPPSGGRGWTGPRLRTGPMRCGGRRRICRQRPFRPAGSRRWSPGSLPARATARRSSGPSTNA